VLYGLIFILTLLVVIGFGYGAAPLGAAAFALLFLWGILGIFSIRVSPFGPIIIRCPNTRGYVALTFDDGPHPVFTEKILALLKKHGARATFFVVADAVKEHPELIQAIIKDGHEIANHSRNHRHFLSFATTGRQRRDIAHCQRTLKEIAGICLRHYRPPMGFKTPATFRAAKKNGLTLVGWHVKGWDTVFIDGAKIARHVLSRMKRGSIILLHDSTTLMEREKQEKQNRFTDRTPTIEAVSLILAGMKEKGFTSVTVRELLRTHEEKET
jgi:peptidoglycan/xylan/chitin deacetylase (PgdA/CDA1 family)